MDQLDRLSGALAPDRGFMHLDDESTAFAGARVVVVPVPFDGTTCYRPGTREGPHAIIDASRNLELYDTELRRSPFAVGIHTLRAVTPVMGNAAGMVDRIEQVTAHLLDRGKFVVTLGGDHSISIGVVRAFAKRHPGMSVLQIDAHADLREEYEGTPLSSATIMRRVLDVCPRTAQVGIRSMSEPEAALVEERKLPMWLASAIHAQTRQGRDEWIEQVVAALADEVYVTIRHGCVRSVAGAGHRDAGAGRAGLVRGDRSAGGGHGAAARDRLRRGGAVAAGGGACQPGGGGQAGLQADRHGGAALAVRGGRCATMDVSWRRGRRATATRRGENCHDHRRQAHDAESRVRGDG